MPPYAELYAVGSEIRIADLPELERFRATWRFHHPLSPEQLPFAGQSATVRAVSYYHGGDVLYELIGALASGTSSVSGQGAVRVLSNKRLKLAARVDYGMSLSSARRSLSAIR